MFAVALDYIDEFSTETFTRNFWRI